ncbi:MAG: trxA [Verrucomicrobiales bacterium]|nr:trxA [Verrucomicrobiales bacterium]
MIRKIWWLVLVLIAGCEVAGPELATVYDLPSAQAQAQKENKLVLLDFTGSDWCPPCKALSKTVFQSGKFKTYAKDNLVFVEVDFPRTKELPAAQKAANEALSEKFKVHGYPTIVVLDSKGKELMNQVGYDGMGPAEFIDGLKKLK